MPRTKTADKLMTHRFHLIDVSLSVPPILLPIFGFSSITAPELTLEHHEIKEGNFEFPRKVFKSAAVNTVTLARGTQLQDSDFWSWADNYTRGNKSKKNLLLVQMMDWNPTLGTGGPEVFGMQVATNFVDVFNSFLNSAGRAWILRNCSPGRYKVASDFDASEAAVSIQEIDIVYEYFIEFNMGITKTK